MGTAIGNVIALASNGKGPRCCGALFAWHGTKSRPLVIDSPSTGICLAAFYPAHRPLWGIYRIFVRVLLPIHCAHLLSEAHLTSALRRLASLSKHFADPSDLL